MCLAIPGKVEEIATEGELRIGRVNFGGVVKRVCLDYVPEIVVGDYTIVHVGFAISRIDEATARETLEAFRAMGMLDEELATEEEMFARAANAPQSSCPDGSCDSPVANSERTWAAGDLRTTADLRTAAVPSTPSLRSIPQDDSEVGKTRR